MDTVTCLRRLGWTVEERPAQPLQLPSEIAARYPVLPASLTEFLDRVAVCINPSQTAWFLCEADFCGTSEAAFHWDEWERLSLTAADGDAEWTAGVRAFWDKHFPFLLSVGNGYRYYAVMTSSDGFGQVVAGSEPEFEEVEVVAESFERFLALLLRGTDLL